MPRLLIIPFLVFFAFSCNEDKFSGSARAGGEFLVGSSCTNGASASQGFKEVTGGRSVKLSVEGEFCSIQVDNQVPATTVLFVVDFSISMDGADPALGSSCGRLEAAKAVLDATSPPGATNPDGSPVRVNVGLVTFGGEATPKVQTMPIASFRDGELRKDNFCQSDGEGTNYDDALIEAQKLLINVPGNRVVYFISDGLPTAYGRSAQGQVILSRQGNTQEARDAGIRSAADLLSTGSILNVLYLQNPDPRYQSTEGIDVPGYLRSIALGGRTPEPGEQVRVQVASSPEDLIVKAEQLQSTPDLALSKSGVSARLVAVGFQPKNIGLRLNENTSTGTFQYVTDPFSPFGRVGETIENRLEVVAGSAQGEHTSVTVIPFTQSN